MFGYQAKIRNLIAESCLELLKKLKEHLFGLIIIMALTILASRKLLFSSDFPAGNDALNWISPISTLTRNRAMFDLWRYGSFGEVYVFTLRLPLSILNLCFYDSLLVVKIFIFTTFLFSGASMYFFTYYCTKRKIASIFSSIIFVINQWYISQWASGHLNHTFAYAILPLVFFSLDKSLKSGKLKPIIMFSTGLTLMLLCRFDPFAYSVPFLILYAISVVAIPYDGMGTKIVSKHILKVVLVGGALVFLFSAFQFIPILSGVRADYISLETSFPIEEFNGYSFGLFESMLGLAKESGSLGWKGGIWWDSHPFLDLAQYRTVMSILVILALSAILFCRNRLTLFFMFSALISIFLAKGPHPPFEEVFLWLYFNVPFFSVLHVPNRWLMITYFSYAFLSGVTVDALFHRLQNLKSFNFVRCLGSHGFFGKMLKLLPYIFVALVTIAMFFPSWYIVSNGLPTWDPPEKYLKPHFWIAGQLGDFRVATVPYSQEYMFIRWEQTGWLEHDLGVQSSLFHGRSVVGRGRWAPYAGDFVSYNYRLILMNGTNNLMKILGAFNVRYLVVQGYLPTEALPRGYDPLYQHNFFCRQKGLQSVYVYENSTVYENEFWTPHLFTGSKYAIVFGGREAFTALTTVDTFNLSNWSLLFADQIVDQLGADHLLELLNGAHLLVFANSEPLDLTMLTLEEAIRIRATDYAYPSTNAHEYWINEDMWTSMGMSVQSRDLLSTSATRSVSMPINVEDNGQYDVWIRLLCGPSRGNLSVTIDGTELGGIVSYARHYSGLKWIKIGSAQLEQGKHDLTLTNKKSTIEWAPGQSNDIDEILLVRSQHLESAVNQTTRLLQQSPAGIVNIIEGEQMFKWATTPHSNDWRTTRQPFNASGGWVALATNETTWIRLKYPVPEDGRYTVALRTMVGPDHGTLQIAVDDTAEYFLNTSSQQPTFKWITLAPITLQSGSHTFNLCSEGRIKIDQMVIYSLNQDEDNITLDEVFKTQKPQAIISYEMANPTRYTVHVETDTPFFLAFSEAYHNLWKAYIDGEEIQSIPGYSFINTFQISKTGEYDMVIEFIGQRYVVYGSILSIGSVTFAVICLTSSVKINRFFTRKLKLKQRMEMRNNR